jgi:hypothetical protein
VPERGEPRTKNGTLDNSGPSQQARRA